MLISLLVTLVFGAIYFYVQLPALNIHAADFYTFVFLLCCCYVCNAKFYTRRSKPTTDFSHLQGSVVQTLFLDLKLLVK